MNQTKYQTHYHLRYVICKFKFMICKHVFHRLTSWTLLWNCPRWMLPEFISHKSMLVQVIHLYHQTATSDCLDQYLPSSVMPYHMTSPRQSEVPGLLWHLLAVSVIFSDSKLYGANMGPIWGRQAPGGPHVGPMYLANWVYHLTMFQSMLISISRFDPFQ